MTGLWKTTLLLSATGVLTLGSLGVVTARQESFGTTGHHMRSRMADWHDSHETAITGCSWKGRQRWHRQGLDMTDGRRWHRMCQHGDRCLGDGQGAALPPANDEPRGERGGTAPAVSSDADQRAFGRSLVADMGCQSCHQLGSGGGRIGPSLNGVVERQGKEYVHSKLADPGFDVANSRMPDFGLSADEIEAIVAYLATLDSA